MDYLPRCYIKNHFLNKYCILILNYSLMANRLDIRCFFVIISQVYNNIYNRLFNFVLV